jgi:VIT family
VRRRLAAHVARQYLSLRGRTGRLNAALDAPATGQLSVPHAGHAAYREALSRSGPCPRHCDRHSGWADRPLCACGGPFRGRVLNGDYYNGWPCRGRSRCDGGYLAARSDLEHYRSELQREKLEIGELPETERAEVRQILREHGLEPKLAQAVTAALTRDQDRWIKFMMRFDLGLEEPEAGRELKSAVTIGSAYVIGGLIPLAPYFFASTVSASLLVSIALPWPLF